ncbi:MAG: polyphenol oxidase [Alphaproteobacteria bacterium CG11_big_fil_rev_8_21_14_0_20_44_7]|nr:MAG: polyphenol oxidase [Alphaproteobacteria bacterium CG11_big_fil_rev_8_21_14_0_20_44_7]
MFLKSEIIKSKHGFFTRQGGGSKGIYESLNCGAGSDDDAEMVKMNRDIVKNALSAKSLITAYQTHSDICAVVNSPSQEITADAMVTKVPGIALGVLTADCVPILLEDKKAGVIGVAHAGWKGARFGIIGSVIRGMENIGAVNIRAVIGPCIRKESYEVSKSFFEVFASETPENNKYFSSSDKEGHLMFDLVEYVGDKLSKHGVLKIDAIAEDTYSQADKFYSYRRATHNGDPDYGRQISVICL